MYSKDTQCNTEESPLVHVPWQTVVVDSQPISVASNTASNAYVVVQFLTGLLIWCENNCNIMRHFQADHAAKESTYVADYAIF